jgi:transcriptional regulator with XRE-family HTH domain
MKMTLGMNIKIARITKGISQGELAEKAGISQNTLCQIEGDNQSPVYGTIEKIAQALKMTVSELTKTG